MHEIEKTKKETIRFFVLEKCGKLWSLFLKIAGDRHRNIPYYKTMEKKAKNRSQLKFFLKTNQRCSEIRPLLHTRNTYTHTHNICSKLKKILTVPKYMDFVISLIIQKDMMEPI